jgi:hypothetical protein
MYGLFLAVRSGHILRKQATTYMIKKYSTGKNPRYEKKISKSPPPKDRREGLGIFLKTSVLGGGGEEKKTNFKEEKDMGGFSKTSKSMNVVKVRV